MKRLCFQLYALLRISEFIFTSNQAPALLFQEVSINKTHIGFYIKDLKTDQYKRGTKFTDFKHTLYLSACTNFCQFRPQIQGRFFCHLNAKPLTKYQFPSLLQQVRQIHWPRHDNF